MNFYPYREIFDNGYKVEWHESVSSTNLLAAQKAEEGESGKLWFVADEQTQGRARRGRHWASEKGNLYTSLLLSERDYGKSEMVAALGFVAGVSMAEAVLEMASHHGASDLPLTLKWPNDIMLAGAKASGILLELIKTSSFGSYLVIGIGINLIHKPHYADYPTASLQEYGLSCGARDLFIAMMRHWAVNFDLWQTPRGAEFIRDKWLSYAAGLKQTISVVNHGKIVSGIFDTIDNDFRCVICAADGCVHTIAAGDVFLGNVASVKAGQK